MKSLRDIIPSTINKLGLSKRFQSQMAILHWREIVGDEIAEHAWPVLVQRGQMLVSVNNSVWNHHLSMMKYDIIDKINNFLGDKVILSMRFQAGYLKNYQNEDKGENADSDDRSLRQKLRAIRLEPEDVQKAHSMVADLADEHLRKKVLRLIFKEMAFTKLKQMNDWHACANCGVLCRPGHSYCTICSIEQKHKQAQQIQETLKEAPWLEYTEINQYIPCTAYQYYSIKKQLINSLLAKLKDGQADNLVASTIVMLITGLKPQQLTKDLIALELEKIRRNKYVFTSGS